MYEDVVTLVLEIEQESTTNSENAYCHPAKLRVYQRDQLVANYEDQLVIKVETIGKLEELLARFGQELEDHHYEDAEKLAEAIGRLLLSELLLTGNTIGRIYKMAIQQPNDFRLRLIVKPQALRRWPWEFLWDEDCDGFLGILRDKTISYSLPTRKLEHRRRTALPRESSPDLPIRVLFVGAQPTDRDWINVRRELDQIVAALRGWCTVIHLDEQPRNVPSTIKTPKIEIYVANHMSRSRLRSVLSRQRFDVFHYVGHGGFSEAIQGYCLALEIDGDLPLADEVSAIEIGEELAKQEMALVILNGCETGQEREAAVGIAQTIASFEIPAVIGMRYKTRNIDSINFAEFFFAGLLDGKPIDFAVNEARNALKRRGIYDLAAGEKIFQGLQYLYPTVCLRPIDGIIFATRGHQQHTKLLRKLEVAILHLTDESLEVALGFLLKHRKEALGLLWIALISENNPLIRSQVAYVLGETGDELAVYPLVEALVRDDDEGVRAACTQALKALGQNPSAISMLVSQYTDENTHPRVLDVLKSIDPVVADSAVWLHDTAEFYKAAQGLYNRVAHLKRDAGYRNSQVTNLIDQIREEHNGYETLKREEEQIDEVIKAMDPDIDTQIEGLSDPTIEDIKERERIRGEKDEKDRELNSRLDSILNLTYRTLSEILETLGFLDITEVSLDILDQMVGWIVQRGNQLELSGIPPDTQKRIADQTHQLDVLRTELQKLLSEEENSWRQLVQTVWEFREDFRTRSS